MKQVQKLLTLQKRKVVQNVLMGMRIPKDFFITTGKGQSDIAVHAGSYHLALKDAGIEMCNIMTYSSILPAIAEKIEKPSHLEHGAVMETIMAVHNSERGELCTASIAYGWLYDKKTGRKYGGLVCEQHGNYTKEAIENELKQSLNELYVNGFSEQFDLKDISINTESFTPDKKFGTALVGLCFTNYAFPVIREI